MHMKGARCKRPGCGRQELFDATTTTDKPQLYHDYPAFRGTETKRVWMCFYCKKLHYVIIGEGNLPQFMKPGWQIPLVPPKHLV